MNYFVDHERGGMPWVTFHRLLKQTNVVTDLREMLAVLSRVYGAPVDIEFALNFLDRDNYRIHLLQCRTFQVQKHAADGLGPREQDRCSVARLIETLAQAHDPSRNLVLVGPGRWGTGSPSLGIPVRAGRIALACAVCEVVAMHGGLIPDVSLGTHFFNDLVEHNLLY
ncbi:pyruvate, phosphate dikinase, partial [bacterium]|nr:pyruvate, phosphate dikinase [bacterium]